VNLPSISIERPVLATVMSLAIVLVGAISLQRLSVRELPDVDPPVVSVTTIYTGAAPEVVETSVTQPLEDELIGIEGIVHITSVSREQVSAVTIEFALDRDLNEAANDVRDRVARARGRLPDEVEEPIVAKQDADASPILWLALASERHTQLELSTLADTQLQDRLSKLPGVSNVIIGGERRYSMRVWIHNARLTALGLTVSDIEAALRRENVDLPSGRIEGSRREFTVRTLGELQTPEQYGEMILAERSGTVVRLRDVARVEAGPESERNMVRVDGNPAVGMGVVKQSKANTVAVADEVRAELEKIRPELPEGVQLNTAFDQSAFVRRSIDDVRTTIFEAVALVVLVIYLFLRSMRATWVPTMAIPVSVIGTFAVLYFLDFSINTLTLMGITLAIGLVVDDAIVVLENITRWIEEGTPPREAAHRGMEEIAFAVLATTGCVVAVFLPLAFLTDQTGRLFREFGVTVAAAVAISGFVALTASPMLCARILRPARSEGAIKRGLERGFEALASGYRWLLGVALRHAVLCTAIGLAWFGLGFWLLQSVPRELIPTSDRGSVMVITEMPEGSTLRETDAFQRQVEKIMLETPETERAFSVLALGLGAPGAVNQGAMFVTLKPWEERERKQQAIVASLFPQLHRVSGMQAFPINPPTLGQGFGAAPVSLVISGPDVEQLARYADEVVNRMRGVPGFVNVRSDLVLNKPQLLVEIDRERAADLGIGAREIATTLQTLLGGRELSTFKRNGETYPVMVQLEESERTRPEELLGLYVRGQGDRLVPLRSVVNVTEATAPRGLPHFDRRRAATVTASLLPGFALGQGLEQIRGTAQEVIGTTPGYSLAFSGESEDFFDSGNALVFAYILAVLIVYLVLAAQFESFLHPGTILVAVALSFTGALVALMATGATLNLYSQIGLVMLIGLVTKNSILIVEFANQLRERGEDLWSAISDASLARFRPILMTAISTIVGIIPIALGSGAGGEARAPLGIAVVGGMLFSTVLTIFVVPAVYLLLARAIDSVNAYRNSALEPAPAAVAAGGGGRPRLHGVSGGSGHGAPKRG
jgi:multidrug efflux pump